MNRYLNTILNISESKNIESTKKSDYILETSGLWIFVINDIQVVVQLSSAGVATEINVTLFFSII